MNTQRVSCFYLPAMARYLRRYSFISSGGGNFHCHFQFIERCQGFIMWSRFLFHFFYFGLRLLHALFIILMIFNFSRLLSALLGWNDINGRRKGDNQIRKCGFIGRHEKGQASAVTQSSQNADCSRSFWQHTSCLRQRVPREINLLLNSPPSIHNCAVVVINYL